MLYSKSKNGFYIREIHKENTPEDVVEITQEYHTELMTGQSRGKSITSDENGYPILVDKLPLSYEDELKRIRLSRDTMLKDNVDSINPIRWETMTEEKKQMWRDYRQKLLDVPQVYMETSALQWPTKPQ